MTPPPLSGTHMDSSMSLPLPGHQRAVTFAASPGREKRSADGLGVAGDGRRARGLRRSFGGGSDGEDGGGFDDFEDDGDAAGFAFASSYDDEYDDDDDDDYLYAYANYAADKTHCNAYIEVGGGGNAVGSALFAVLDDMFEPWKAASVESLRPEVRRHYRPTLSDRSRLTGRRSLVMEPRRIIIDTDPGAEVGATRESGGVFVAGGVPTHRSYAYGSASAEMVAAGGAEALRGMLEEDDRLSRIFVTTALGGGTGSAAIGPLVDELRGTFGLRDLVVLAVVPTLSRDGGGGGGGGGGEGGGGGGRRGAGGKSVRWSNRPATAPTVGLRGSSAANARRGFGGASAALAADQAYAPQPGDGGDLGRRDLVCPNAVLALSALADRSAGFVLVSNQAVRTMLRRSRGGGRDGSGDGASYANVNTLMARALANLAMVDPLLPMEEATDEQLDGGGAGLFRSLAYGEQNASLCSPQRLAKHLMTGAASLTWSRPLRGKTMSGPGSVVHLSGLMAFGTPAGPFREAVADQLVALHPPFLHTDVATPLQLELVSHAFPRSTFPSGTLCGVTSSAAGLVQHVADRADGSAAAGARGWRSFADAGMGDDLEAAREAVRRSSDLHVALVS